MFLQKFPLQGYISILVPPEKKKRGKSCLWLLNTSSGNYVDHLHLHSFMENMAAFICTKEKGRSFVSKPSLLVT